MNQAPIPLKTLRDFYEGNHWPHWVGPKPLGNDPDAMTALAELERIFVSANKIAECVDRHVSGLVGQEFYWSLLREDGTKADPDDPANAALTQWLSHVADQSLQRDGRLHPIAQAVTDMAVFGRGYLRLWMPKALSARASELERIMLHAPRPEAVTVDYDDDGFVEKYQYCSGTNSETQELDYENGLLLVDVLGQEPATYDLDGHWLIVQLKASPLITRDVITLQNAINLGLTSMARNVISGGFLERVVTGSSLPGRYEDLPGGGRRFVQEPLTLGPGRTAFLQGNPTYDDLGNIKAYTTPSIDYHEPSTAEAFTGPIQANIELLYHLFGQGHLLASDTQMAGVARVVSQSDAETRILQHEFVIVRALEAVLKTVLILLGLGDGLTPSVQLRKAAKALTPEQQRSIIEQLNAGLLSRVSAIAQLGQVEDADAELLLIEAELSDRAAKAEQTTLEDEEAGGDGNSA